MMEKHEKVMALMDDIMGHQQTIREAQREVRHMERELTQTVLDAGWIDCITINKRALRRKFSRK